MRHVQRVFKEATLGPFSRCTANAGGLRQAGALQERAIALLGEPLINGADAARFIVRLGQLLSDVLQPRRALVMRRSKVGVGCSVGNVKDAFPSLHFRVYPILFQLPSPMRGQ